MKVTSEASHVVASPPSRQSSVPLEPKDEANKFPNGAREGGKGEFWEDQGSVAEVGEVLLSHPLPGIPSPRQFREIPGRPTVRRPELL